MYCISNAFVKIVNCICPLLPSQSLHYAMCGANVGSVGDLPEKPLVNTLALAQHFTDTSLPNKFKTYLYGFCAIQIRGWLYIP